MGTSTVSVSRCMEKTICSSSTEAFFNHAVKLHVHWFVQCYKNEPMAQRRRWASLWLCSPPKPARKASPPHLRFLRVKRLRRAAHSTARNAVLVPISQGTEVTIVTEYVPFRYSTCTASVRHQAQAEPSGSSMAWVSSRIVDTWCPDNVDRPSEGGAWTMLVKWTHKTVLASRMWQTKQKGLWPARQGRPGYITLQMWTARTSWQPHKFPKWTPRWTMPRRRQCLWWNGLWLGSWWRRRWQLLCFALQCLYCFCLFFLFFVSQARSALPGMNCWTFGRTHHKIFYRILITRTLCWTL